MKEAPSPRLLKAMPSIQWVRPVPPAALQLRTVPSLPMDGESDRANRFIMFDGKDNDGDAGKKYSNYKETDDTFHRAMGPVITIGQCFGLMPLAGIRKPDASYLRFSLCSLRMGYTCVCIACTGMMATHCIFYMAYSGIDIYKTISTMFFSNSCMSQILFLRLAPRWSATSLAIARRERVRPTLVRRATERRSLRSRMIVCCVAVLVPALIEHLLSNLSGLAAADYCNRELPLFQIYFTNAYLQVFYFTDFSYFKGIVLQIINFESTFNWNFMDLFIITVSLALTDRFEQLNERLEAVKGKHLPDQFWKVAREEFAHLSWLVKEVDGVINEIVLLSFANNLYFICVQLFNSLNKSEELLNSNVNHHSPPQCSGQTLGQMTVLYNTLYFTFSFSFLMLRSLAVSLCASRIHTASQQAAPVLYAVPSSSYNSEMHRFLEQVVTDTVALTGMNFFHVTRGLALTIAGTIVTYELVLVQFNASPPRVTANITINDKCGIPITT